MAPRRAQVGNSLRSSLALALMLVSLPLGSLYFHAGCSLEPEPLSGEHEMFMAAEHPFAPIHMEDAGVATHRRAWPPYLHLIKSIRTKTLPVVAVFWPDSHRAPVTTEAPHISTVTRSCRGYRGPPPRFV